MEHKEQELNQDIKELFAAKKVGSSHIEQNSKTKDVKQQFLNKQKEEKNRSNKTTIMLYLNKERDIKLQNFLSELKKDGEDIKVQEAIYFLIDNYL